MADPTPTNETSENETVDAQAFYLAQQEADIQRMREAGHEDSARYLEVMRDNADKAVYQDADTGAQVTILDGDSESIKPYIEMTYSRALEFEGGLEQLIESVRENSQKDVDAGTLTQAAMDKRLEMVTEAGTDSAKYAELRFANNDFFAEQAGLAGQDADSANDVTLIQNVPQVTSTTSVINDDGTQGEPETEIIREASNLTNDTLNMDTLIKVADGNQLTAAGNLYVMSDIMAEMMGRPMGIDPVEVFKDKFDELLAEHGSVDALATHLEQNMSELTGDQAISPEMQTGILEAVRNSEGDSARFAATVMNDVMPALTPTPTNPGADPAAEVVENERRATDLQNLLGPGGLNFDLGGNEGLLNIVGMFIAIFTGQDPETVIAELRQQNQPEGTGETPTTDPSANGGLAAREETPSTPTTPVTPVVAGGGQGNTSDPSIEEPVTKDDVEERAMQIAHESLTSNAAFAAVQSQLDNINADLDAKEASGELTGEERSAAWHQQTEGLLEQMGAMATQVKNDAREFAANEMGVDFASMYPELAAPADGEPEVTVADNTPQNDTAVVGTPDETTNVVPDEVDVADVTVEEPTEEVVEVVSVDEDKGYVESPMGGPVTYAVDIPVNGEPVRSAEGDLYQFADGGNLSSGFDGSVNPTQVAMVDPFADAMAALEKIGYDSPSNNSLNTMMA